ncbi:hypothetical protein [Sphingomonas sp. HMP6]|uniref:hypothetical protein n=1 Tax=Sphingomonas sp. HMP6 TaxID=1517551 RepID=UPI0015966101|nr:hypothetical protein [Sphingomonas sp. HMP6]BCA59479.1 hypothetical protein HMP06_2248 [Sphingomonas sp. HMP6]
MASTEQVPMWFGSISRIMGADDSTLLAQLPMGIYPDPEPACATCPAKDWYLTAKELRCYCTARGVISWVSNDAPVMACDAREQLIEDAEDRAGAGQTD